MPNIVKKVIEWDRRRKFGHKFEDFVLLLVASMVLTLVVTYVSKEINYMQIFITVFVCATLWNRKNPDDTY